jgi:hypothetical protein
MALASVTVASFNYETCIPDNTGSTQSDPDIANDLNSIIPSDL